MCECESACVNCAWEGMGRVVSLHLWKDGKGLASCTRVFRVPRRDVRDRTVCHSAESTLTWDEVTRQQGCAV